MTNLIAILVSLAMMLTGAAAPVAEPVSRTIQVSNFTVRHNEEEVVLSPTASLGVMTDGAKAVFDFFIANGGDVCLPFQAVADENQLLVLNDTSGVTLKVDKADVDAMLDAVGMDEDSLAMLGVMSDYMRAYGALFGLMDDPEAMQALQADADAIFDEMVERGDGEDGTLEYEGEIVDVTTYEYDLSAAQIGALSDAVYACNKDLAAYADAYFRLLKALPEDSGLSDADSFEALLAKFGDILSMHVVESISDGGLNVSDVIVHVAVPDMAQPVEFVVHSVKNGDERTANMNAEIDMDGMAATLYMESSQSGRDTQVDMTITGNPTDIETPDEADAAGEADADDEDDVPVDGESDAEDAFYFTVDFDSGYDEAAQTANRSLSCAMDIADPDIHIDYSIECAKPDDGADSFQLSGGLTVGDDAYGFDLDATLTDAPIEVRAAAEGAVSLDDFDPAALIAGVGADVQKLLADEGVQQMTAMAQAAMSAVESAVSVEDIVVEAETPREMTFGNPQFNWLPEGYAVDGINVDEEYQDVNCTLVNAATGDNIFIDITASYSDSTVNHYILGKDGGYTPIEGVVLNEEVGDGYAMYNLDDGNVAISIFPSGTALSTEDIVNLVSGLSF